MTQAPPGDVVAQVPRSTARRHGRTSLALFLVGTVVSLVGSWHPSLWTDEAATISAGQRSLPQLWAMAHHIDVVHAVYYAFMHGWLQVFPPTPFLLRLPSALAAGLVTVGTFWLARRLASTWVAVLGAVILAVLPRTTWMGMEARPYAFSALLAVALSLTLVVVVSSATSSADVDRAGQGRRRFGRLTLYGLLAALGIAVNIYLALLLVAHGISLLLHRGVSWRLRWTWLAASLVGVLLASPVVWTATQQTGQLGGGAFGPGAWLRNVIVSQWFLGETPTPTTGGAADWSLSLVSLWKPAAVALALVCWVLVLVGVLGRRRSVPLLVWTLPWLVVPTVVLGLYSIGVHDVYNPRYFTFCTPPLALLIGQGLAALRRRRLTAVAVAAIILCALPVYVSQRTLYAKSSTDWSGVAAFVAANRSDAGRQGVYFSPRYPITGPLVGQTARGVRTAYPEAFVGMDDITLLRTGVQDANLSGTSRLLQDSTAQLARVDTVWVVRRNDYAYPRQDDQTLLAAGFRPGRQWRGPVDQVLEFTRR